MQQGAEKRGKTAWILGAIGVLLIVGLGGRAFVSTQTPSSRTLPQDPDIQVYMNQRIGVEYTDPYRQVKRSGDDLETVMIQTIREAKSTVEVAVQELRLPRIAQALQDRQKAGVKVRVVLENQYARPYSSYTPGEASQLPQVEQSRYQDNFLLIDANGDQQLSAEEIQTRDALVILQNAGIPMLDDTGDGSRGSGLMHHKWIVVDGKTVIVTSANFTLSDVHGDMGRPASRGNANNLLKINSPALAQSMSTEFNQLWGDGPGGQTNSRFGVQKDPRPPVTLPVGQGQVTVKFSPDSRSQLWRLTSNGLIDQTLAQAQTSVDLALFVFSEQALANTLQTAHQRGVQIRALIDPGFAYPYYSEALDMMGIALMQGNRQSQSCRWEANNNPWTTPIQTVGVPRLPPGDKLHHKFAVLDQSTVITGSQNWSAAANHQNDETVLVVNNPVVAAHYDQEMERLYSQSLLGIPAAIQRKVEQQQQQCTR